MLFIETALKGVLLIEPERLEDERGFFARTWCMREFEARGLDATIAQCSVSFNRKKGTLRGMHYQAPPHEESKQVRCTQGAVYDVVLDIRPDSPTYRRWVAFELSAKNHRMLFIPPGFAHGFLTLEDETELHYQISAFHHPESARGVRWNDPAFAIAWPFEPTVMSARDGGYELQ